MRNQHVIINILLILISLVVGIISCLEEKG